MVILLAFETGTVVRVRISKDGKELSFQGKIVEENDGFLTIDDRKEGLMQINKSHVVIVHEVNDGS